MFEKENVRKLEKNIRKDEFISLRKLASNPGIVILKPDKGNGVVLMNKIDYLEKAYSILNDNTKFRKIFSDNTDKMEAKLNRLLEKLHQAGHLDKAKYTNLRSFGAHAFFWCSSGKILWPTESLLTDCSVKTHNLCKWDILPCYSKIFNTAISTVSLQ